MPGELCTGPQALQGEGVRALSPARFADMLLSMPATSFTRRHVLAAAAALASTPALAQPVRTRARLETAKGVIVVELADDKAPITVANFLHYVDSGHMV